MNVSAFRWRDAKRMIESLAASQRGALLSAGRITGPTSIVRIRCEYGHTWELTAASALDGKWCPTCSRHPRIPLSEVEAEVKRRGGAIVRVPDGYDGAKSLLIVRCASGHEWETSGKSIRRGKWCRHCIPRQTLGFDKIAATAAARGGRIISPANDYENTLSVVRVRCSADHEWDVEARQLRGGRWCKRCAGHTEVTFEEIAASVARRGGVILSEPFAVGEMQRTTVRVRCEAGHEWETNARNLWRGAWCARCAGKQPHSLDEFRKLAVDRGGKCLSRRYGVVTDTLRFRCAEGHVFERQGWRALRGAWCHACERIRPIRETVAARGGMLLSRTVRTQDDRLRLLCGQGHRWSATKRELARGVWCARCAAAPDG